MNSVDDLSGRLDFPASSEYRETVPPGSIWQEVRGGILPIALVLGVIGLGLPYGTRAVIGLVFAAGTLTSRKTGLGSWLADSPGIIRIPYWVLCGSWASSVTLVVAGVDALIPFVSVGVLSLCTWFAHREHGQRPFQVHRSYQFASYWLRQSTRGAARRIAESASAERLALLVAVGGTLGFLFGPLGPASLGIACGAWTLKEKHLWGRAIRIVRLFAKHPAQCDVPYRPGCWYPMSARLGRRRAGRDMVATAVLALIVPCIDAPLAAVAVHNIGFDLLLAIGVAPCVLMAAYLPALRDAQELKEEVWEHRDARDGRETFEMVVDRLREATEPVPNVSGGGFSKEQDHLLVGFGAEDGCPLLYPRDLEGSAYITGAPASGKTRHLMGLTIQLVRGRVSDVGETEEPPAMVYIDLKGDRAWFHTAAEESRRAGQEFLHVTTKEEFPGYRFNPLETLLARGRDPAMLKSQLGGALSALHGEFYGAGHFGAEGLRVLDAAIREPGALETFESLAVALDKHAPKRHQGIELVNVVSRVAGYRQLHCSGDSPQRVLMEDVLEKGQALYLFLDQSAGEQAPREIARLTLATLLHAAEERQDAGKKTLCYVLVDEFQTLAASSADLQRVLEKGRGLGLRFVLSHQNRKSLKVSKVADLTAAVDTCRYKHMFSVDDAEQVRDLQLLGGQEWIDVPSYNSKDVTWSRQLHPRLDANQIMESSEAELGSLVCLGRTWGLAWSGRQIVQAWGPYTLPKAVYDEREVQPLPRISLDYSEPKRFRGLITRGPQSNGTTPTLPGWLQQSPPTSAAAGPSGSSRPRKRSNPRPKRRAAMVTLFRELLARERADLPPV